MRMKFIFKMEKVLITVTGVLCIILILKLIYSLRTILPWRVNCWFCNSNFWLKYLERNSWTCKKCDQYNGFTKDGDYNKQITSSNEQSLKTAKLSPSCSPPQNGLCKMCNINQQLKVAQLANFVPMNDKNFDEEIEVYRMQLERAYRLCSPCKKVLQIKLYKEKEVLLGTKLLETRTPDKKSLKQEVQSRKLQSFVNTTSMYVAGILLILVTCECYSNVLKNKSLMTTITNLRDILYALFERIISIIKMKTSMTFPMLENYLFNVNNLHLDKLYKYLHFTSDKFHRYNTLTQEALGGFVCLMQLIGHVWNINKLKFTVATDLLWTIFVITSIAHHSVAVDPAVLSIVKLFSTLAILLIYRRLKININQTKKILTTPKKMKSHHNRTINLLSCEEDNSMETDDDVSLSHFGLHNLSESSNETISPLNTSLINGRSFSPRSHDSLWTKPKLNSTFNSTFCVHPVLKSPNSVSDSVFAKPNFQKLTKEESFKKYQKLTKEDSDSDLDESISSLCIGSPKKSKKNSSIFALRKFTATPNFVAPTPLTRSRPLISPSKLGHSTSWVAGGYWGTEGERQIFSVNGSRSSSQSSGFESQASSMNQRNVMSQPPSREESICGDLDRSSVMLDRFQHDMTRSLPNCNMSNFGCQGPQNFSRISSPVFPQMQYNGHVRIPQPRFAQQSAPSVFSQQFGQNSMFKTPGGSGLIRLPQNSFAR